MHGKIELRLWHGRDRKGRWHGPLLLEGGIGSRKQLTPGARRRACAAASLTGPYQEAAEICQEWGFEVDDSILHRLVQEMGAKAETLAVQRLSHVRPAPAAAPPPAPAALGVLLIDGCMLRFRGEDWGRTKPSENHVEWHEMKRLLHLGRRGRLREGGAPATGRQTGGQQPGDGDRPRRTPPLGSPGSRTVPGASAAVRQRWGGLDLEAGGQPVGHRRAGARLLPCKPASARPRRGRRRVGQAAAQTAGRGRSTKLLDELAALTLPSGKAGTTVRREQNYLGKR